MTAPSNVISILRERRPKDDCQGERPNLLLMSQLKDTARALDIDFSIRTKALQEREHKDAWRDFKAACDQLKKAAPKDPREQMILFIKDMAS